MERNQSNPVKRDDLLGPEEAATLVGRSLSTIWRKHAAGQLSAVEVAGRTRFRRTELLRLVEPRVRRARKTANALTSERRLGQGGVQGDADGTGNSTKKS